MSWGFKQKKMAKFFAIFVLIGFLSFSALSSVMYFTSPKESADLEQAIFACEELGWERDESLSDCILVSDSELAETQESCEQKWWTWYDANEVCIIED